MAEVERDLEGLLLQLRGYCTVMCSIPVAEIQALVAELDREETLMPLLDPTAYLKLSTSLHDHKRLMRYVLEFRQKLEEFRP